MAVLAVHLLLLALKRPAVIPKAERPIAPTKQRAFEAALARSQSLPSVLLVRTFDPGNVGSAARAMLNFGLCDLRLAAPLCEDWRTEEAVLRASGAAPLLEHATEFESIRAATADLQLVLATTARTRDANLPVHTAREAAGIAAEAVARGERVGFVFGSEKNGLSNDELRSVHALVRIPTEKDFSSLNLAQAVLLLAYEWAMAAPPGEDPEAESTEADPEAEDPASVWAPMDARAPMEALQMLTDFWEGALWSSGFFGRGGGIEAPSKQEAVRAAAAMDKLRTLILRAQPSAGEAGLLRGALQALVEPPRERQRGRREAQPEGGQQAAEAEEQDASSAEEGEDASVDPQDASVDPQGGWEPPLKLPLL